MSFLSFTYVIMFYAASLVLFIGLGRKIYQYAKTPAPLKIPTMPAPLTNTGVVMRMGREVVFFESLFKANKWTWIFGWLFHVSLVLVFLRHLRYVFPQDSIIGAVIGLELIQSFGKYASYTMVIGLLGLLGRRIFVDRVRYISSPSDYLMLLLIIGIAATGMLMVFVSHVDIMQLRAFVVGLFILQPVAVPTQLLILIHLALVAILMFIFPISKLLHAPGVFFSPSRNQKDNSREQRHIADWAVPLDKTRGNK